MTLDRYNIRNLQKALREPRYFINELTRLKNRILKQKLTSILYDGENFLKKDWDNMIILDACRPDFFEETISIDSSSYNYSRKISLGASSNEYFIRNAKEHQYYDTVYVTGNTSVEHVNNSFYKIIKTYGNAQNYKQGWKPDVTFEAAIEAYEQHPNKRIVTHFMQPHTPYLSERAEDLRQRVSKEHNVGFRAVQSVRNDDSDHDNLFSNLVEAFEHEYISRAELQTVYTENLELVFEYVETLLNKIDGKTVITADHSESLGDFSGIPTHKDWALSRKLREVPWVEIEDERRDIIAEEPVEPVSVGEDTIQENLRDLGYL